MKTNPITIVRHPEYGTGKVLEIRSDPLPHCRCAECRQKAPRPSHLMLVRWDDSSKHGVAGGWYDPMNQRFTFENVAALVRQLRMG